MKLMNMVIKEVSLVDQPANKKKFLLYKRDNGGGEPVKIKVEDIAKMSEADLRKILGEFVTAQDALEKSVADFEAKVKKAAEAHEADLKELEKKDADIKAREASVIAKEAELKKQDEPKVCTACEWKGVAADLTEGKCPKCGAAVKSPAAEAEKAIADAVAKAKADLEKAHAEAIKERDDVIDELVGAVDTLKKTAITKADIENIIKEAVASFKKNLK